MSTVPDARIRVATLNCLHGMDVRTGAAGTVGGSAQEAVSLDALAAHLEQLEADVITLQEVDRGLQRSAGIDQTAWLAHRLSMDHVFAPALLGDPDGTWAAAPARDPGGPSYGVGILSRRRIVTTYRLRLPGGPPPGRRSSPRARLRAAHHWSATIGRILPRRSPRWPGWDFEPRIALRAEVAWHDGVIAFTTTHCSYLPWRALRQLGTAARLATRPPRLPRGGADSRRGPLSGALLLGDLNLPPVAVRARLPGWHHGGGGPTYPAYDPRLQLDHVLAARPLVIEDASTAAATSDHRALVATVRVPGAALGRGRQ